ncbi:hypothetical protein KSP35_13445 [Aquihabitans sp. G128]|uniref:hypothetical protein n=1 Tax=Aquihabitans sp. G128 TaxID=2849779 RepID=UPI001C249740|nr:hypothetical protein [Aquihabitans sp. G128]QXC59404.1 hypothetical protein KSP35_13445 [Aquihabitans sp. G128]
MTAAVPPAASAAPAPDPSRRRVVVARARGVAGDVWEQFVAGDLDSGFIRTRGLGAGMTALVVVASTVFFALVGVFLTNQHWRARYQLVPLGEDLPGRGAFVPAPLLPLVFFLLAFALSLVLAGALHAAWWVRVATVVVYLGVASSASLAAHGSGSSAAVEWGGRVLLLAVPVLFAVRWRARPRPAGEFCALFVLVSGSLLVGLHELSRLDRVGDAALSARLASSFFVGLAGLLGPRLVMAGLDTVSFGASVSLWALRVIDQRVHALAAGVVLVGFGGWRLRDVVVGVAGSGADDGWGATGRQLLAGALLLALVAATWWVVDAVVDRYEGEEATDPDVVAGAKRLVLPLGTLYLAAVTALGVAAVVAAGIDAQSGTATPRLSPAVGRLIARYSGAGTERWQPVVFSLVLVAASGVLARRTGGRTSALVLAEVGVVGLWSQLAVTGRPLASLGSGLDHTDPWIVAGVVGLAAWWTARRDLDRHRVARLLFVLLLSGLVAQGTFLGNPFELVLGFAGVGFVAFGLVWGYLTAGSWTNAESPAFPRSSRILLFLGYTIFTLTVGTWFVLSHDLANKTLLSDSWARLGSDLFGQPMLLALVVITLAGTSSSRLFAAPAPAVAAAADEPDEGR